MWQAIKNVATYGGALMFVLVVVFIVSNIACCGALGTLGVVGSQIDEAGTIEQGNP